MASERIVATFVYEKDTAYSSVYSELVPGQVIHTLRINTVSLRQVYGEVPTRLQVTIEALDSELQPGEAPILPPMGRHSR
jgi:hypothetical protein